MQTWNLSAGDPLSLTLAADARLTTTDYTDDQIWELSLSGGEPAALALQTTYGLRAHWMRIFPRFVRGEVTHANATRSEGSRSESVRIDPASFHSPPRLVHFSPNYLAVTYTPFEGLNVQAEYWAAESQVVVGRIKLTNQSILPINFHMEWVAMLNPIDRQGGMVPEAVGPSHVLTGETANLHPVLMLTGGPRPVQSPYPALALDLELYPSNSRQVTWVIASMRTYEASLETARTAAARPWEAEQTRMELLNFSQSVQIQTGNPEWDAAFALSQKTAFELVQKNNLFLSNPSFVLSRRPDHGFSHRGDGSDYPFSWSGQTALDTYFLSSLLLPGAPDLAAGLLRNFLSVQDENGMIDLMPGLGGQRSKKLSQPVLATLAVQIAPYMKEPDWYQEVFPPLLDFFDNWFSDPYDRDRDGFPEWEHPTQTGIEDSPVFDRWSPYGQGINIQRLESPGLAAMLYRECQCLVQMARALTGTEGGADSAAAAYARLAGGANPALAAAQEALPGLLEREAALHEVLESTWDEQARTYRYRDYQTHLSLPGEVLMEFTGTGKAGSRKRFPQPRRLIFQIKTCEERTYAATITIHGFTQSGETSETIAPHHVSWLGSQARATSENAFLAVKRIEVQGLGKEDTVRVLTADYTQEDCSLLLPLWAGSPDNDRAQCLIQGTLLPRYMQLFGIPLCPPDKYLQEALPGMHSAISSSIMPWNHLAGEGLLHYGYRKEAAELVTRLMNTIVQTLKNYQAFRQYYHSETGLAAGERDHLYGLAPVGLFLQTLGIRQLSPKEILIDGFNPYPSVIHVQYRKVHLTCHPDKTEIQFPGGQSITIDRPGPQRVVLS